MDLDGLIAELDRQLADADAALERQFPGERAGRQPVHTVYVPADRFDAGTVRSYGNAAQMAVVEHGAVFHDLLDGDEDLVDRVLTKLETEPVEDLRIDFEDGYGARPGAEEDQAATAAARALRATLEAGDLGPSHGIRFKSFERATRERGVRTLARFLESLGEIPDGFVVTLPKVTSVDQVEAMVVLAERLEPAPGSLRFEIQVETPQSVLGPDGTALIARMIHAAEGRCTGLHYGTYDYSAYLGVAAAQQSLDHPVADHAKAVMQAAAAGTGVRLSDGSSNILPVGDADAVRHGWEQHLRLVRRSLERGFYQGWDLHPAQLPTRYAATFAFYREGFVAAGNRLRAAGRALRDGSSLASSGTMSQRAPERTPGHTTRILEEPATARALAGFLLRGLDCGALTAGELRSTTGLDVRNITRLAGRNDPKG